MGVEFLKQKEEEDILSLIKEYIDISDKRSSLKDKNYLFRNKEINNTINALKKEINSLKECDNKDDFSFNQEEKEFYIKRFYLFLTLI